MSTSSAHEGTVHVDFRKWQNILHWQFEMEVAGTDEHGLWLFAPAGTTVRRGLEPPKVQEFPWVKLITENNWWSAVWNAEDEFEVYVDIATPAVWSGTTVTMIDLDLDVVRYRGNGAVAILDEDEFIQHQQELGYPARLIDRARSAAALLVGALESASEPFGSAGRGWLEKMAGRSRATE